MKSNNPSIYGECAKCHKQFPHEELEGIEDGIWFVSVCEGRKEST